MDTQEQQDRSPLTLFYSYADKDEELCEELEKHLSVLQRQGMIVGGSIARFCQGLIRTRSALNSSLRHRSSYC